MYGHVFNITSFLFLECQDQSLQKPCRWGVLHQDLSKPFDLGRSEVQLLARFLLLKVESFSESWDFNGRLRPIITASTMINGLVRISLVFHVKQVIFYMIFTTIFAQGFLKPSNSHGLLFPLFFPIGILTLTSIAEGSVMPFLKRSQFYRL